MSSLPLTSLTNLPTDVLLNTGRLFVGNTFLGVTRGGLAFNPQVTRRNIPYDGQPGPVEQLDWDTFSEATFSGRFIQFSGASALARFEPGSTSAAGSGNVTTVITPKATGLLYAAGDYLSNLRQVWQLKSGGFVQVRFPKALCTQYDFAGEDRGETLVNATFGARVPLSTAAGINPGTKPYVIEKLSTFS